jgi:prepilin-type N-terminal cleavage/methylation domain-containing protein
MMLPPAAPPRRPGFTLVELLVVIGIIALLIGIAVPSLARARDVARRSKTAAELAAIGTDLEVFHTDFREYPASDAVRLDPLTDLPNADNRDSPIMQGAHWLARALAGSDGEGVDAEGLILKDRSFVQEEPGGGRLIGAAGDGHGASIQALQKTPRKARYLGDPRLLAQDTDTSRFAKKLGPGRLVLVDAFNGPILYYRANAQAPFPFGAYSNAPGPADGPAVYNLWDNASITGCNRGATVLPWDFANTGLNHGLGYFGPAPADMLSNPGLVDSDVPPTSSVYRGKSFAAFLHDHGIHTTSGVIKPIKPDGFLLLSAGKDAVFGTEDDVTDFNRK